MLRAINDHILKDLSSKIVLLSGPRQAGKTTLAKSLYPEFEYLNYDSKPDQRVIRAQNWGRKKPILILDELHKMKNWKRFLKGIYDTEDLKQKIIVTGSARMEIARRMGDSLAGRHFSYTLYPLTMRELNDETAIDSNFTKLLHLGGFPEPFLKGDEKFAARWRIAHLDIILRQDLLDLEQIRRVGDLETLLDLLRVRVGSPVSMQSLAEDLQVDQKTVKRWLTILENLYLVFSVAPYAKNIPRGLVKMRKYYFFDCGQVEGDEGSKLENLVALSILREIDFLRDTQGRKLSLHYVRDKEGNEIDFVVVEKGTVKVIVEVKWQDDRPAKAFLRFQTLKPERAYQIVGKLNRERAIGDSLQIISAGPWLHGLQL